jgi:anti-sigma factor RsiW
MASLFYRARFSWDHRWTPGHMSAYVDGELGSGGRLRLERHVSECEQCRRILAALRETLNALRRRPAPPADSKPKPSGESKPNQIVAAVRLRLREPPPED